MAEKLATGGCLCGAVRYEVQGPLRQVIACHCTMCRRTTGSYVHATAAMLSDFRLIEETGLAWYRSSPQAKRGFCKICGANLFWQGDGLAYLSIMAGTLDGESGLKLVRHIYAGEKGDYYDLEDGVSRQDDGDHVVKIPAT
jgi:hypothetical protein